jgi:ribonuclease P protein component
MSKYKLPKSARSTSRTGFRSVFEHNLFVKNNLMTLYMATNRAARPRFAVSVSAKTAASAVIRNRLKRLAREAFRLSRHTIPNNLDYLIIFSGMLSKSSSCDIKKLSFSQVRDSFLELVRQGQKRFEKKQDKN